MAPKAWNQELVQALRAKESEQQAKNSDSWLMWQRAASAVEAVRKDIKITSTQVIQNLPKESREFTKTCKDYCEQIMRGLNRVPQMVRPPVASVSSHTGEHPYLRRMTYRGGGYAILRALWDAEKSDNYSGYLTIDQICRMGQKYCDSPMKSDHFGRGDHGHGWESNKSLLENRFIERDKAGKAWSTNFRGPKDRIRLTEAGREFVPKMLQKFAVQDDGQPDALSAPQLLRKVKETRQSPQDLEELQNWALNAAIGEEKEFQVSKARRHFLHNEIQKLNVTGAKGYVLEKHSRGDGRQRTLVVKKKPWNGEPSTLPSASARTSAPSMIHTGLMDFNQLLPEVSSNASNELGGPSITGPGHRLGGTVSKDTGKREASALAAERRMSVSQPLKRPRLSRPAVAAPVEPINTAASSSSESDSEDEELQKVMALSLEETKTPEIDEEERQLQEAMRLSLESTPSSQGNPSPQRFARLSAASSAAPMELDASDDSQPLGEHAIEANDLVLSVDLQERRTDKHPRDIYEELQKRLEGLAVVKHEKLKMGDYMWTRGTEVLGVCIERKTMRDLIGRSAKGDHVRQLRRLSFSPLCGALLLEGDVATAQQQVAYGADFLPSGPLDCALRDAFDVRCFLARQALLRRNFLLLSSNALDSATCLAALSEVIRESSSEHLPRVALEEFKGATEKSDKEHADLLASLEAAGTFSVEDVELLGRRFHSLEELRGTYERCPKGEKQQLLLAPLLQLGETAESAVDPAITKSCDFHATLSGETMELTARAVEMPKWRLKVMATQKMAKDLQSMPSNCCVEECRAPFKDVEEVQVQLQGIEKFTSFKSARLQIYVLTGGQVLRFLSRASRKVDSMKVAKVASAAAEGMVSSLRITKPRIPWLFFEGVELAAKQVCQKGQNEPCFAVAKDAAKLCHALVAVLALRYGLYALTWRNRSNVKEFMVAVLKEFSETQLLDQ